MPKLAPKLASILSVSDQSGQCPDTPEENKQGSGQPRKPGRPRGIQVQRQCLTDQQWQRIRTHYETSPEKIALRPLAQLYGVPEQTVMKRSAKEKWARREHITTIANREVEQEMQLAVQTIAKPAIAAMTKKALDDLAPWIERKKRKHIRSLVNLGERGVKRVSKMMKNALPTDAKAEAFKAKTAETWDTIIRRNLGMGDSGAAAGSLSLQILTGSAAIQINQGKQEGQ